MNMECNVHDTITHSGRGVLLLQTDEMSFFTVFLSVLFSLHRICACHNQRDKDTSAYLT